jgi:hypothetical protein
VNIDAKQTGVIGGITELNGTAIGACVKTASNKDLKF